MADARRDRTGPDARQLGWIAQNARGRARSPQTLGQIAEAWLTSDLWTGPAWRRAILRVMDEQAGELRDLVEVESLKDGVLTLSVGEPTRLYHLRIHWEQRLLDVVRAHVPESGVHTVRFVLSRNPLAG